LEQINLSAEDGTITFTFNELLGNSTPSAADFQITQDGEAVEISSVTIDGVSVVLSAEGVTDGALQVSYTPSINRIQDVLGNAVPSFTQMVVSDGYIRNAEVYADTNNDGIADEAELIAGITSDALGQLVISGDYGDAQIIIKGGVNVDTGAVNQIELTAPVGYSVINPLSTLVQEMISSDDSQTLAQAEAVLTQVLGISLAVGEDLSSYDPISDVSENAISNRVATSQIATVLSVAATADTENNSDTSNIETVALKNLATMLMSATETLTLDAQKVSEILSDNSGASLLSSAELSVVTTAVEAMETIKQTSGSIEIATALEEMVKAQALAIDKVSPANPSLNLASDQLIISFNTELTDGSAVIAGDTVRLFDGENPVYSYVLQQADIEQGKYDIKLDDLVDLDDISNLTAKIIDIAGNKSDLTGKSTFNNVKPTLAQVVAVNRCNYTKSVGPDNFIIFDITASESLMKPTVTVAGEEVEITGGYNSWAGEYHFTGPYENNYPTVAELQDKVKGFVASFPNTPDFKDIELFTTFSELGGADLAAALAAEYNIEISQEEQLDSALRYGSLFERILAKELPSVNKLKQVLAPYNKKIIKDIGGNVLDVPLSFLSLGTPSVDNKQTDAVIKAITTAFDVKTTQEELDRITSHDSPQYAWIDKIQSLEIPVTITYADTSGMVGEDVTLTSTDALRYCDDGVCQCFPEDITGTWQLRPKAGSMGVGRAEGNIGDWSATDFVWGTERACLWDDQYIFKARDINDTQHGSFSQNMGDATWLESWQPPNIGIRECGTPYPPFDGSTPNMTYEWNIEEGTLTLFGLGAHIALSRVANNEENQGIPFDRPVVYNIETASEDLITLNIRSGGPSPWWHFELIKVASVEIDDAEVSDVLPDSDLDGVPDIEDAFPNNQFEWRDTDEDGIGNNTDTDDDNDGIDDNSDADPWRADNSFEWFFYLESLGDNAIISGNHHRFFTNNGTLDNTSASFKLGSHLHNYNETIRFGAGFGANLLIEASIPAGQTETSARLTFEFEAEGDGSSCIYPDVLVSGSDRRTYTIHIPPQGEAVFNDILLQIQTPNIGVEIHDIRLWSGWTSEINPLITGEAINFPVIQDCNEYPNVEGPQISFDDWNISEQYAEDWSVFYVQNHPFGTPYEFPEVSAYDNYDGYAQVVFEGEVGNELGVYELVVSSTDSTGNRNFVPLNVEVIDQEPPIISLNGDSAMILGVGSDFVDPGAIAVDNHDGTMLLNEDSISYKQLLSNGQQIDVEGISTDFLAEYEITYQFEDSSGNTASVTRLIIVAPPEGEIIDIIKDGAIGATWDAPISAYDQDLNWNSCVAPSGCPNIDWAFVNDSDLDSDGSPRGDVLEVTHAETERLAGVIIASTTGVNIRSATKGFLKFDLKIIEGGPSVTFKTDCGYPCSGIDQYHTVSELNKWETVIVPISSVRQGGLDLGNIRAALVINGTDVQIDDTLTRFRLDNVSFDCRADTCAGEEAPFELVDWAATHEDPNDPQAYFAPTSYPGYTLAWSDEFDGDSVNTDNWSFDIGNGDNGWGNGELEYYREDNASVDDGLLIIEAQKHVPPIDLPLKTGNRYTSSKLTSIDKVEFKYGRVDIRAVVAEGQGMWSAGWMLGANNAEIGWPYSGEIDIFDTIGGTKDGVPQEGMIVNDMYWSPMGSDPSEPYNVQHINNNGNAEYRINASNVGETFSNRFHVFSLIWDEDNIKFEVDGVNTGNDVALVGALAETYRNPFFLILNVAVGAAWPGPPDETTTFPDGMLVDYVRVYQTDSDGDGIADFELDGETPLDNCYGCYEALDAPFFTSSPTPSINENIGENQVVYTAQASDDTVVTYSLQAGHDSGLSIDASTGEVSLDVNPDSYTKYEYSFTVVATDTSDNSSELAVNLTVIEIDNVAPMITSAATATSIDESSGAGQVIYTAVADDSLDISNGITYSLIDENGGAISGPAESVVSVPELAAATQHVYVSSSTKSEDGSQETLVISYNADDATTTGMGVRIHFDSTKLSVSSLENVLSQDNIFANAVPTANNDNFDGDSSTDSYVYIAWASLFGAWPGSAPTDLATLTFDIAPDASGSSAINFTASSNASGFAFDGQSHEVAITAEATSALSINSETGEVSLVVNPDYETQAQYSFEVVATDAAGNASEAQSVTLDINDLDEVAPVITSSQYASPIDANAGPGTIVYVATADDSLDISAGVNFSLSPESDSAISIDSLTGQVILNTYADYWVQHVYYITIVASDGYYSTLQNIEIPVHFVDNNPPIITSDDVATVDENSGVGQIIYVVSGHDNETNVENFFLYEGYPLFIIDEFTGEVTLTINPDYEQQSQYTFAVQAMDIWGNFSQPHYVTLYINDIDENTHGPLDMTGAYGNGAISGDDGEFFKNDTSLGFDYSGFANSITELYPFEFGTGGTLEFTASVPTGESVDVSFQLQKQGSDSGLLCDIGSVWNSDATTVSSANAQIFTIEIPAQGGDTFSSMIMQLSEDDINVKITDVYVTTSEKTDAEQTVPAQCDGSLDMTGAYGNGAVSGEGEEAGTLFMNDTSLGLAFSGFANGTTDAYPFEFGSGGTLEFTASVPAGQSTTAVDVNFQFQKQGSDTGKFCDIAPIWKSSNTVSGPVDETFTVAIPSQGGNTFSNLIMELSVDDVIVKITGVKVTPSDKTADAPTVPKICEASPLPSVYPVDGINSAAMFNGTFGDEEGGLATIQSFDSYEFPTGSASYGGWSNGNPTLYPIEYTGGGFFAQKKIYFCASTTEAATVYFRFEDEPYPANSTTYNTASVSLTADGVMRAYASDVPITYAVNSLLFLMLERDTPITMGKVMGNWNGLPTQNITTDTDGDGVVDYCEDFPNDTPDWVDTDGDGASNDADAFPDDATQWEATP
jgi:beta-glucanase (GH16 family)